MKSIFTTVFLSLTLIGMAQVSTHSQHTTEESLKGTSRLTLGLGHTYITEENINEGNNWLGVNSWSLNYDYWLSNKWAIGLQNDILFESFLVENIEGEKIERSYPLATIPVAMYKVLPQLTLIGGVGLEYSKTRTLTMSRFGLEYGLELKHNKEVGVALVWDYNWDHYNSIGIAFTISNIWGKK